MVHCFRNKRKVKPQRREHYKQFLLYFLVAAGEETEVDQTVVQNVFVKSVSNASQLSPQERQTAETE